MTAPGLSLAGLGAAFAILGWPAWNLRLLDDGSALVGELEGHRLLGTYARASTLLNVVMWTALAGDRAMYLSGICLADEYQRAEAKLDVHRRLPRLGPATPAGSR